MQLVAWDVVEKGQFATGSGPKLTPRTILITEYVARDLARGYTSKRDLENALIATARRPAYERAYSNYWANPGSAFDPARYTVDQHLRKIIRDENGALTDPPPWFPKVPGLEKMYTVPVMRAGVTAILVTGDQDRNKVQTIPGGSPATIAIKLPANWDTLMEDLGYRPLKEFFLNQRARRWRQDACAMKAASATTSPITTRHNTVPQPRKTPTVLSGAVRHCTIGFGR